MLADEVCSTEKMVTYCKQSPAKCLIIATEPGMIHRLQKECPDKVFIPAPTERCACNNCKYMKLNTLEKLHDCLADGAPEIHLSADIIQKARAPIERMLEVSARP
jgi:quinolinate synthase